MAAGALRALAADRGAGERDRPLATPSLPGCVLERHGFGPRSVRERVGPENVATARPKFLTFDAARDTVDTVERAAGDDRFPRGWAPKWHGMTGEDVSIPEHSTWL